MRNKLGDHLAVQHSHPQSFDVLTFARSKDDMKERGGEGEGRREMEEQSIFAVFTSNNYDYPNLSVAVIDGVDAAAVASFQRRTNLLNLSHKLPATYVYMLCSHTTEIHINFGVSRVPLRKKRAAKKKM